MIVMLNSRVKAERPESAAGQLFNDRGAQGTAPGREASLSDLLNDLTGAMMAGALMLWQHSTSTRTDQFEPALRANLPHLRKGTSSR